MHNERIYMHKQNVVNEAFIFNQNMPEISIEAVCKLFDEP
jgi:hypothetical protein